VVSTVDDMLRWMANMERHRVGTAATWKEMTTRQKLANGTSTAYGLGLTLTSYRGVETIHHTGAWVGSYAQMLKVPAAGLDVVVMANRDDVASHVLAERILDACLLGLDPIGESHQGAPSAGVYRSRATAKVIRLYVDGGQQIASIDGMALPVAPDPDGVLWPTGVFSVNRFGIALRGDQKESASVLLNEFGNLDELVRVPPTSKVDGQAVVGRYRSDSTGTDVTIDHGATGFKMTSSGRFGSKEFALESLAEGIWQAKPKDFAPGILTFTRYSRGFDYSDPFTRSLPFRRCDEVQ
jgi:D-aminopeptidase